jgi:hypothetical protein
VETEKKTLGRNDPCHCGSGKKYKACHLSKDEDVAREARAKEQATQAAAAPAPAEDTETPATPAAPADRPHTRESRNATPHPWKRSQSGTRTAPRFSAPRRSGGS